MILSFYKKNEVWDREDIDFVFPHENDLIKSYSSNDVFDKPSVGDTIILDDLYKVFKTVADYKRKEIYVIVEKL